VDITPVMLGSDAAVEKAYGGKRKTMDGDLRGREAPRVYGPMYG